MTVYTFPTDAIASQLFYTGGQYFQGGFTSGGARISSPEPGGRSFLEIQPSLQINEWSAPFWSWLMSNCTSGEVFHIPVVSTPQVYKSSDIDSSLSDVGADTAPWEPWGILTQPVWDNNQQWLLDGLGMTIIAGSLEGSQKIYITDEFLKAGQVIGHKNVCYMVKDVFADHVIVKPPLRKDVGVDDVVLFKPTFTGEITNGDAMRNKYIASKGHGLIDIGNIIFAEVIE